MHTIKDVAKTAGVSIASVSNYLNRTKPVSIDTERKIREAIEKLNYTPNVIAKSLKSKQYYDIGVILPNLDDPYYSQIFQGIERTFWDTNYFLNLTFSYDIPEIEQKLINNFLKKNICGLILVTSQPNNWTYFYKHLKDVPLVLIDRMIYNLDTTFLSFNNKAVILDITSQLLKQDKQKIILMTGSETFYCEEQCICGYREAHKQFGIVPDEKNIVTVKLNKEDAFQKTINAFKKGFIKNSLPEAVVVTSELCAMGVVEALTLLGITRSEVPVISLGEEHWNRYTHSFSNNSTVRPAIGMGRSASECLLAQIKSPRTYEKRSIVLDEHLVCFNDNNNIIPQQPYKSPISRTIKILMVDTPQTQTIMGFIPGFQNATGIRVEIDILPQNKLLQYLLTITPDDEKSPDVFMYDIPWLYELSSGGILADITDYIKDPSFDETIFLPGCLKHYSEFEKRYYGLPFMFAPQIFYYRKDLFNNETLSLLYQKQFRSKLIPPRTWNEFTALADFFTQCDVPENTVEYGTSIPAAYKECMVPEIYMRLQSYGGSIFDKNSNVTLNSPGALKAYINYKRTVKVAKPDPADTTDISAVSDFVNGKTAMLITYPSFLTNTADISAIGLIDSIGYSFIPGKASILGGWSLGINANSNKKDDSFEFLKWTTTKENANYFTLSGAQPAIDSIFSNDELIKLFPALPLYRSSYKYTQPIKPPYRKGLPIISQDKIDEIVFRYGMELINDGIDVQQAINLTQEALCELFKQCGY